MQPQVSLRPWRHGMSADGRMAIKTMDCAGTANPEPREVRSENGVTPKRRRCDQQRNKSRPENIRRDVDRATDAANLCRRIERRTNLVVDVGRAESFERLQRGPEFTFHGSRRER